MKKTLGYPVTGSRFWTNGSKIWNVPGSWITQMGWLNHIELITIMISSIHYLILSAIIVPDYTSITTSSLRLVLCPPRCACNDVNHFCPHLIRHVGVFHLGASDGLTILHQYTTTCQTSWKSKRAVCHDKKKPCKICTPARAGPAYTYQRNHMYLYNIYIYIILLYIYINICIYMCTYICLYIFHIPKYDHVSRPKAPSCINK